MKKCSSCGERIDIMTQPYANAYPHAMGKEMETYHLECLVHKIRIESIEEAQ